MIDDELLKKLDRLKDYFKGRKVIVAYSGGVDSSLVAKVASDAAMEAVAITIDNGFFSKDVIERAKNRAKRYNINHKIISIDYLKDESIINNIEDRCYLCKKKIATELLKEKNKLNYDLIVDGTIYDDLFEDRPGIKAIREYGIESPLANFKFSKKDVHELSKYLGMEIPKKDTCLATRVLTPPITKDRLKKIKKAEDFLKTTMELSGYFRVRDFNNVAIIEVNENEINKFFNKGVVEKIDNELKKIGFKRVCLDLKCK